MAKRSREEKEASKATEALGSSATTKKKKKNKKKKNKTKASSSVTADGLSTSKLSEDLLSSPFLVQQLDLVVSLLPSCLSDVQHHISKNVNGLLMKYNEGAQGVIISYR